MKRNSLLPFLLAIEVACTVALSWGQRPFMIEPALAPASADLPKALADALEPQGTRLVKLFNGLGIPVCEVWWLKAVPTRKNAGGSSDVIYGNLSVGTLVGVLRFLTKGDDFRDQDLEPGFYTLRYAQMPQDGNHFGVSPYRDFVLLSPVSADTKIDQVLKFEELLKLSRQASGTGHPAIISLVPVNPAYKKLPVVISDDKGNCALQVRLREKPAGVGQEQEVQFSILLVSPRKGEELGS